MNDAANPRAFKAQKWSADCFNIVMILRSLLVLAGLIITGIVGTFLFFVSALSLLTVAALLFGLGSALLLGFMAGAHSLETPANTPLSQREVSVKTARAKPLPIASFQS